MRQAKSNFILKTPVIYSMAVHCAVLALMAVPSFTPRKNDIILTDVQVVGEGELQDILNNYQTEPVKTTPPEEPKEPKEEEPVKEEANPEIPNEEQLPAVEPERPEEPPQPQPELSTPTPVPEEPPSSDEIVFEELPQSEPPAPEKESSREEVKEEVVEHEEPIPKPEEKPKKVIPEVKKTSKKRRQKMLQDVIRRVEKKKAKEKNRKKMLEIAENAEKVKKIAQKKKNDGAFDKMLNNSINDLKKVSGKGQKGQGAGSFGSGTSLVDSDYEIISSQIYPHWAVPSGVRDAENIIIEMEVQLRDSGEVIPSGVKILDERRYASDYVFRAAADSARRAVLEASPLRIPNDKISLFKKFTLRFNLREALGG